MTGWVGKAEDNIVQRMKRKQKAAGLGKKDELKVDRRGKSAGERQKALKLAK